MGVSGAVLVGSGAGAVVTWTESRSSGPSTWELTWSDEFAGTAGTLPNSSKWRFYEGGVGNNELERYVKLNDPDNAAQKHASLDGNGHLVITAYENTDPNLRCPNQESATVCAATSARLDTYQKFSQQAGRFEANIKVPAGKGLWPAFWGKGTGTLVNEMDIMEQIGNANGEAGKAHSALHGTDDLHLTSTYTLASGNFSDAYHLFAADWYPDHINYSIDGVSYHTIYRAQVESLGKQWPLVEDFYLILNLAVGGDWPGPPDETTPFPAQMYIDYVRVYQQTAPKVNAVGAITNHNDKCVDVAQSNPPDGTVIQQYTCNGTQPQTWTLATDGTIRAFGSCLTVPATAPGSKAEARACVPNDLTQQWRVEMGAQSGSVKMAQLYHSASGKCLQVPATGAQLEIQPCGPALGQAWSVPAGPTNHWRLTDGTGTTAKDFSRNANHAACASGVTWTPDAVRGTVAEFSGAQSCATGTGPVVNTGQSFTVSARVKLPGVPLTGNKTAVSQDGAQQSGFYLQYSGSLNAWGFNRMSADIANPTNNTGTYGTTTPTAAWTHLTGVYNAADTTLRLYVNGTAEGTPVAVANPWSATGPLVLGRGKWNGNPADFFPGLISDVQVWNRALNAQEVKSVALYQ
ncbi:LamG-like jellyroll fold domain-containing protein [Actinocorallia herbida]|nr:LamG-like jellyroll fold domain-containing protein [Actinocorallia herbida]